MKKTGCRNWSKNIMLEFISYMYFILSIKFVRKLAAIFEFVKLFSYFSAIFGFFKTLFIHISFLSQPIVTTIEKADTWVIVRAVYISLVVCAFFIVKTPSTRVPILSKLRAEYNKCKDEIRQRLEQCDMPLGTFFLYDQYLVTSSKIVECR